MSCGGQTAIRLPHSHFLASCYEGKIEFNGLLAVN